MFDIRKTDNISEKIEIGKQIVEAQSRIYSENVIDCIRKSISDFKKLGGVDELFYLSVYDYWLYGANTEEEFYLNFINKTCQEKNEFITHMDRINYMHHMNKTEDEYLLRHKYETYKVLKDYYKRDVIFVKNIEDLDTFTDFCRKHKEFVVKPVGLATSIGVKKYSINDEDDIEVVFHSIIAEVQSVEKSVSWVTDTGIIVEEVIGQGIELAVLHPKSINSVRLTTIKVGDKVNIFYPVLRIGKGGNFLCCGAVGSILTGVNATTGISETIGRNEFAEEYTVHPDTGIQIQGIQMPKWQELCSMAKELAMKFPTLNYIGWDFVWTDKGEWSVMEANENGEFLCQIAYQKGVKKEFIEMIGWESPKKYWWIGKYD